MPRTTPTTATPLEQPTVAVDVVLLTVEEGALRTVLVQREEQPFTGQWALPGVAVRADESLDAAAARALADKAGLRDAFLEQLYTFGALDRDPRSRTIAVAYYALVPADVLHAALEQRPDRTLATVVVPWQGEAGGPVSACDDDGTPLPLAFDHAAVLGTAVQRIRGKLDYSAIGFELLPRRFPLRELQRIHETILGQPVNKDSFRRRMLQSGRVRATGQREVDTPYRPAELHEFVPGAATTPGDQEVPR